MREMTTDYGAWRSPITAELIACGAISLRGTRLTSTGIYWIESRPTEGGRSVIMRNYNGHTNELTPAPFNVRSRVHEYGGGEYLVTDDKIYFTNFVDQKLYAQSIEGNDVPQPLTKGEGLRYADTILDARHNRLIAVREDHRLAPSSEAINTLVAIDLTTGQEEILVEGNDFYMSPRLSPDGQQLAWLSWSHPQMPWDGCQLWLADLTATGALTNHRLIVGSETESIVQPEWSPTGQLYFVSDRTDWWNLYCYNGQEIRLVCPRSAEFAAPHWQFGMTTYGFSSATEILSAYTEQGFWNLARINTSTGELQPLVTPYTEIDEVSVYGQQVLFCGGSAKLPMSVVLLDLTSGDIQVLSSTIKLAIDAEYLSTPEAIEFPTENGLTAYGFYYPPQNRDFQCPQGQLPPLLVRSHGGPTGATSTALSLTIQYWTSHGFGVLDVNYSGSTGYGRRYRERLHHQWGIADVADCVNGASYLVKQGRVDGNRLAIYGGSAGGYTTLCALTFYNLFKAGASYYGVSDIKSLDAETHKFESRYSNSLIGTYPIDPQLYHDRSPINFIDRISCPLILLQGLDDKVVLPNQAEMMFDALKAKGLPVAYVAFAGEGHGFRKAENIQKALESEHYFYAQIFGFEPLEKLAAVEIENLRRAE